MARESKTRTALGTGSAPCMPGSSWESRGCLSAAASFVFLNDFLPGCQVSGRIKGGQGPGHAGCTLDIVGKGEADGACDAGSLPCSISHQAISNWQLSAP